MSDAVVRWLGVFGGVGLMLGAGGLYVEFLGVTDAVLIQAGAIAFRNPWSGQVYSTPFSVVDLWGTAKTFAAIILAGLSLVGVLVWLGHGRKVPEIKERWPTGAKGVFAALILGAATVSFIPVDGHGGMLSLYFLLGTSGFLLLIRAVLRGRGQGYGATTPPQDPGADNSVSGEGPSWTLPRLYHILSSRDWADAPLWILLPALFLVMLGLATLVSIKVFGGVPHVVDGVSHLFQARIFASGRFFIPSHPLPEFFDVQTVVNNGRWFSQYTPGHSALLFLGDRLGTPWMVNPVLGALTVPALFLLAREAYGKRTGLLAGVLALLSPFMVFMSGEYYSHTSALLFLTLFMLHLIRFTSDEAMKNALLAGFFLGLAILSRPLTALAVAAPFALDASISLARSWGIRRAIGYVLLSAVVLVFVGALLLYNRETTGGFLTFGYSQAVGPGFGLGERFPWEMSLRRLARLNDALFGWPLPSLVLVVAVFLADRPCRMDYVFAGVFFSLVIAHAPVAYNDAEFGPRYLYEASGVLVILSARGFLLLHECLGRLFGRPFPRDWTRRAAGLAMAGAFLFSASFGWVSRGVHYSSPSWKWAREDAGVEVVRAAGIANALVFVQGAGWNQAFLLNGLDPDTLDVIFAKDLGERNSELASYYPDRDYYVAGKWGVARIDLP